MNESNTFVILILGLLVGMLMAFGLVLIVMFFGSSDTCRATLYGQVHTFVKAI